MKHILQATAASVALGLALAPVQGQLLGGGLGGGVNLPSGAIGGMGGADVSRMGDSVQATGAVSETVSHSHHHTVNPVTTEAVSGDLAVRGAIPRETHSVDTRVVTTTRASVSHVTVPAVRLVVPTVPQLEIRRSGIAASGIVAVPYAEVPTYIDNQAVVLERELHGTGVEVIKRKNQIVLEMPDDVTFAFNKSDIQPRFFVTLNIVARTLNNYPATYVDVNGHTDAIGSYGYNQVLSERRAGSVADYLTYRAVVPARMHVQGFGKTEPIASNATIQGRAANRRVEIILTPYAA